MTGNWRKDYPALVAEAQALGSIAVIRSLGLAGYPVHACSPDPEALGLRSRYVMSRTVSPDYFTSNFAEWLSDYVRIHKIQAIVPSEAFLLAIRPNFAEFASLLPYSSSEEVVYTGMSKADQVAALIPKEGSANHVPPFLLLDGPKAMPDDEALSQLKFPVYIKVDGLHGIGINESSVYQVSNMEEARKRLQKLIPLYRKMLVQSHVSGTGAGAFFLIWDDVVRAEFMHIRLHEVPHTGGASSYRKSWHHAAIRQDALAKLRALRWQGVAMMEYRWDPQTDEYHFLEMNGRFWGSLHLSLHAGVNFPALLLDVFHGHPIDREKCTAVDVSCRYTFPKEVMYVWSCWKDPSLKWAKKVGVFLEFCVLGLDPRVRSDLWFRGDRLLYWRQFWRFIKSLLPLYERVVGAAGSLSKTKTSRSSRNPVLPTGNEGKI